MPSIIKKLKKLLKKRIAGLRKKQNSIIGLKKQSEIESKVENKIEKTGQLKDQAKHSNIRIKNFQKERTEKMEGINHQLNKSRSFP